MINSNNISKIIKSQSTGNEESAAQAFSQNYWVKIKDTITNPIIWETPVYILEGATRNYYSYDYNGLSTDINNGKDITMVFTANTFSLSGITILNHKLYRIDYKTFIEAQKNVMSTAYTITLLNNLSEPLYTFSEALTAATISAGRYKYNFPTQIKRVGEFTTNVFEDKAQYFVDSEFVFPINVDETLGDFLILSTVTSGNTVQLLDYYHDNYSLLKSNLGSYVITGNTPFSGLTVTGAYFTYMVPPKKPNLEVSNGDSTIAIQGRLNTFSPIFNFNGVDDGDYYQLQVTYNTTDFQFEDSSVATFKINKQEGDAEYVRTFNTILTPNREFLYRIINVKEIENIFGVKYTSYAPSDYVAAETASDGKYVFSGTVYQGYISPSTVLAGVSLELRGIYSTTTIKKGIDIRASESLVGISDVVIGDGQNSGVVLTTTSDANGEFSFGRIDGGNYQLRVIPPVSLSSSISTSVYNINITADTDMDILLSIIWGSTLVRFDDPFTFL